MAETMISAASKLAFMLDFVEPSVEKLVPVMRSFTDDVGFTNADFYTDEGSGAYYIYEPLQYSLEQGIKQNVAAGGDYPAAVAAQLTRSRYQVLASHATMALDQDQLQKIGKSPGQVWNYLNETIAGGMLSYGLDVENVLHHGASGKIVKATDEDDAAGGVPIDNPYMVAWMIGRYVDWASPGATPGITHGDSVILVDVDVANKKAIFSGTVTAVVGGDVLTQEDAVLTQDYPVCQFGIPDAIGAADVDLIDTSTDYPFGNISRATTGNGFWKGKIHNQASKPLTFEVMQLCIDLVSAATKGTPPDRIYANDEFLRAYQRAWHQRHKPLAIPQYEIKPGWKTMAYISDGDELGIVKDNRVPSGEAWFLTKGVFKLRQISPPKFRDMGAIGKLLPHVTAKKFYAYIDHIWNLTCRNPQANCRLYGVKVT